MKWIEILFWIVFWGGAGFGLFALVYASALFWYSTTPLIDSDLEQNYIRDASLWFVGFLACSTGVFCLFTQGRKLLHRVPGAGE